MPTPLIVLASAVLLAACASPGNLASGSPAGSSAAAASPSPSGSPAPKTCISSSEGPEIPCELEAGTYTTEFLLPQLTYAVPSAGWSSLNREVSPGNFHLFPPGGSMAGFNDGTTDVITVLSAAVPPGGCSQQPSDKFDQTFDGLVQFLESNDHLVVSNEHDVTVGGWEGVVMDVTYAKSDGCADGDYVVLMVGVYPSHGLFAITPSMLGARMYVLRDPAADTALAIEVDDASGGGDLGDGADWYDAAQSVIDTFVLTP